MKNLLIIGQEVRDYYIKRFLEARDEALEFGDIELEMPLCDESGDVKTEGRLATGAKIDIVIFSDDIPIRSINVDTQSMLDFRGASATLADQAVTLFACQWNSLQISMNAVSVDSVEAALVAWFNDWFEREDENLAPLFGCVHFIADPIWNGSRGKTTIDMGSSPVAALIELIGALQSVGASEIEIGAPSAAASASEIPRLCNSDSRSDGSESQ